ncbi:uncharacterized protein LOC106662629 isoform X1 [Cimex lectularius]|uniref:Potassium channel domain-containing protein n=1 Tax=Cimex lectularius TaxID=79782 RepID=A0A8I6RAI5_CIMLE|nr:uncharacterized protein LOC106662629 isoform X1 [Cimex lectularius]
MMSDRDFALGSEKAPSPVIRRPARRSPTTGHRKKKIEIKRSQSTPRETIVPTSSDDDAQILHPRRKSLTPDRGEPKKTIRKKHKLKQKLAEDVKKDFKEITKPEVPKISEIETSILKDIEQEEKTHEVDDFSVIGQLENVETEKPSQEKEKCEENTAPSLSSWFSSKFSWNPWTSITSKKTETESEEEAYEIIDKSETQVSECENSDENPEDEVGHDNDFSSDFAKMVALVEIKKEETTQKDEGPSNKEIFFHCIRNSRAEFQKMKAEMPEEMATLRKMWNRCTCKLFIILILCGVGSVSFKFTEGAFESFYKCGVKRVKRDFIDELWRGSHFMREDEWKSKARRKLMDFENQLQDAFEAGMTTYSGQKSWSFLNGIIYVLTVISTIGYGHIVPITTAGRALTIAYAIIGVPLFLTLLADFGKMFTRMIKLMWVYVRRLYYTGSPRKFPKMKQDEGSPDVASSTGYTIDDEFNLPITIALIVFLAYLFIGAIIFYLWEEWSFFESFYFVFISMATIGFGDFVPENQIYMMLSIVYLVFGLALTSMCINVVQEKLSSTFAQASAKLGATIGFDLGEECEVIQVESPLPVKPQSAPASVSTTNPALDITPPKKGILHKGKHTQN